MSTASAWSQVRSQMLTVAAKSVESVPVDALGEAASSFFVSLCRLHQVVKTGKKDELAKAADRASGFARSFGNETVSAILNSVKSGVLQGDGGAVALGVSLKWVLLAFALQARFGASRGVQTDLDQFLKKIPDDGSGSYDLAGAPTSTWIGKALQDASKQGLAPQELGKLIGSLALKDGSIRGWGLLRAEADGVESAEGLVVVVQNSGDAAGLKGLKKQLVDLIQTEVQGILNPLYTRELDAYRLIRSFGSEMSKSAGAGAAKTVAVPELSYSGLDMLISRYESGEKKVDVTELRRAFGKLTEVAVKPAIQRFSPMVEELAGALSKKAQLKVVGTDFTLSRENLDKLCDSLVHMIRNAMDHAIETPEERTASGKGDTGTIEVEINSDMDKGLTLIVVRDDGRGMNPARIRDRAKSKGLKSEAELAKMSDQQVIELIFLPEFSTKEQVTDVSGRGVGMDVVKSTIEGMGGSVHLTSVVGKGSEIRIQL